MQPIQQVFANPDYFKGLRTLTTLPDSVWVVDDDSLEYKTPDFATISEAIDAAKDGDTIFVFPGTYNEAVTISKKLTIYGNGAYIDPLPTNRPGGESIITNQFPVTVTSSDVTFSGFELTEFYNGITIPSTAFVTPDFMLRNITLSYNYLHAQDVWTGISVQGGHLDGYEISHSIIDINRPTTSTPTYALACINFSKHDTATPIYQNIVIRSNILRNQTGYYDIFAGATPSLYTIDHCVIECNHFLNQKDSTVEDGASFNIGNISDGRFENNVVEHAPGSIGIDSGVIRGNSFLHGASLKLWGTEYGFKRPSKNLVIENNEFSNEVFGNSIHIRQGCCCDSIHSNYNAFADSGISPDSLLDITHGYAIRNDTPLVHDVTLNWWDNPQGPEGCSAKTYGAVKTNPWIREFHLDQRRPGKLCWPLSTFRKTPPGFYPHMIKGISYVGNHCFEIRECVELEALVSFKGGNGKNIPVEFNICNHKYSTKTTIGGCATVKIGCLCPGTYTVHLCAGDVQSTTSIHVCCHYDI